MINGLPSSIPDPRLNRAEQALARETRPDADAGAAGNAAARADTARVTLPQTPATRPATRPTSAVPAEPPAGTDPALWSVLTTEERSFFSRMATTGPLTYSKIMGANTQPPAAAMPRGGRLDLKV